VGIVDARKSFPSLNCGIDLCFSIPTPIRLDEISFLVCCVLG
jgi:hypothetical protein